MEGIRRGSKSERQVEGGRLMTCITLSFKSLIERLNVSRSNWRRGRRFNPYSQFDLGTDGTDGGVVGFNV